jgi:hypothetical protein
LADSSLPRRAAAEGLGAAASRCHRRLRYCRRSTDGRCGADPAHQRHHHRPGAGRCDHRRRPSLRRPPQPGSDHLGGHRARFAVGGCAALRRCPVGGRRGRRDRCQPDVRAARGGHRRNDTHRAGPVAVRAHRHLRPAGSDLGIGAAPRRRHRGGRGRRLRDCGDLVHKLDRLREPGRHHRSHRHRHLHWHRAIRHDRLRLAQLSGAIAATLLFRWLLPALPRLADEAVIPHDRGSIEP